MIPKEKSDNKIKLPELLSPCGSPEALDAAVKGGADAVYLGGQAFNARINAHNFSSDDISEAVKKCRAEGVRLYVTFNTLVYDRELCDALRYAEFLYKSGADALIIADIGLAGAISSYFPDFELHASTQLSGHSADAAKFLASHSFTRMVCARELSFENIKQLVSQSPIEIEMFVHGAMCVSHSGQCLMSSVIGGRSGNRGLCAQPCRMKYNGAYPLSLRDMCLAGHISEIIQSGVSSLKIEGRMKSPEYVYGVTKIYRRLLDESRNASNSDIERLTALFSRGGFSDGYFTGKTDRSMLGVRSENDKAATRKISGGGFEHTESGFTKKTVNGAGNAVIKRAAPDASLPDTGARSFRLPEDISLNLLSRHGESPKNDPHIGAGANISAGISTGRFAKRSARFLSADNIPDGAKEFFDIIYLPLEKISADKRHIASGAVLPPVITDSETAETEKMLFDAYKAGVRHFLVGNPGHIQLVLKFKNTVENALKNALGNDLDGVILHGDFRLNVFNRLSADFYGKYFADVIASPELTLPQLRDVGKNKVVIVYGRLPLMLCEKRIGADSLTDRTGAKFPVVCEGGRDLILNSVEIYMADRKKVLKEYGVFCTHFIFTTENRAAVSEVINSYKNGEPPKKESVKRIKIK